MDTCLNFPLIAALSAIAVAQLLKYPIARLMKSERAHLSLIYSTGGMPSSHTAGAIALLVALIMRHGFASSYVAIAFCYALIVMYDAHGVRRQSGDQGHAIEILFKSLIDRAEKQQDQQLLAEIKKVDIDRSVINKFHGHKPQEIWAGALTGFLVTLAVRLFFELLNWPI